jgi:hypothetical protein
VPPQAAKAAGGPTRVEKAKIGLIQFHLSPPKADIENTVVISDYAQVRSRDASGGPVGSLSHDSGVLSHVTCPRLPSHALAMFPIMA